MTTGHTPSAISAPLDPSDSASFPTGRAAEAPRDFLGGRYEVIGLLGEGGMGRVWRAHCVALDVDVAIKVLHRQHADAHGAARLLREARATASLTHPSIVRTLDFGETAEGEAFLVMELLAGSSLADRIDEQGRWPATKAVQLMLPVASGLVAAHAQGIVHRDLKPENILIVPDGAGNEIPKIVDFGIAKVESVRGGKVLTEAGSVLGSLEYMAPEQASGKEVSAQTDVWGFSVVLYELITGRRPFAGADLTTIVLALHVCKPTPITELGAGDAELWEIIGRGLMRDPEARWPGMRAMGVALAEWAERRGVTEDSVGTSLSHQWHARPSAPPVLVGGPAVADRSDTPTMEGIPALAERRAPSSRSGLANSAANVDLVASLRPLVTTAMSDTRTVARHSERRRTRVSRVVAFALLVLPVLAIMALTARSEGLGQAGRQEGPRALRLVPGVALLARAAGHGAALHPEPVPDPEPTKEAAPQAQVKSARIASSATRARRVPSSMPLPTTPNF